MGKVSRYFQEKNEWGVKWVEVELGANGVGECEDGWGAGEYLEEVCRRAAERLDSSLVRRGGGVVGSVMSVGLKRSSIVADDEERRRSLACEWPPDGVLWHDHGLATASQFRRHSATLSYCPARETALSRGYNNSSVWLVTTIETWHKISWSVAKEH